MSMASLLTEEEERHELDEPNAWWTTLRHQGVLLSPIVLEEIFPSGPPTPGEGKHEQLRRRYRRFRNDPEDELYEWLDVVLEEFLEYPSKRWKKEHLVSSKFTTPDHRPNRVLLESDRDDEPDGRMLVWIDDDRVTTDEGDPGRIGIYSGKREHANLVKLMRETGVSLGLLTNGHQFRLVHATLDQESWTEWEASAWFEGGEGRVSLWGFRGLLSESVLPAPPEDEEGSLLGRIQESRDRQADLSDVMGTQVREAVELLLQELDDVLMQVDEETREDILAPLRELQTSRRDELRARYQAAIRIVMRLVVALYAESRELFPKENPIYFESYSVEGLFRDLREARIEEGEDSLEQQYGAWARFQALSRLVYSGSPHKDVPMRGYGGRLFRPPEEDGDDEVLAALAAFEHDAVRISDAAMLRVLEKLKIAEFRSGGERRTGPVDFSDLRTEYIGMMYEGLLDYDLREATEEDGAIVFLNIGDQPALPFNVLKNLDEQGMENLVDNLKNDASGDFLAEEEARPEDLEDEEEEIDAPDDLTEEFTDDLEANVHKWAKKVVEETRVYMPHLNTVRAMDPTVRDRVENEAAKKLVDRIIRPGGIYLVSWSGTRKSTGTFYTPPGLAIPTVHRTLEPLAYDELEDRTQIPKQPEELLDLKVCDPAMGSGTFPVAALNYLTRALKESFEYHVLPQINEGDPIAAPLGEIAQGYLNERLLEIRKGEGQFWEDKLEIQLKRAVVERCIYGVDINPLAVELGKLSLWMETLDPDLPFTFLDHKLRVGNSLIGAWLNEFEHYPVAAWNRTGGDGSKGDRTKRIKEFRSGGLKDQMHTYIRENLNETHWFKPDSADQTDDLLRKAQKTYEELHESVDDKERERLYLEEFREDEDMKTLRYLMDRWCAIWFWPMDSDDTPILDPDTFYKKTKDVDTRELVQSLASHQRLNFFHWEIEFPDVFQGSAAGFDAVIGNPPWEIIASETKKFFSRYDPVFTTYSRKKANERKEELLSSSKKINDTWNRHKEIQKSKSNYYKPGPLMNKRLGEKYPFEVPDPQYNLQGSGKIDLYRTFLERSLRTTNHKGRIGLVVKGTFTSDQPSAELRKELVANRSIDWVFNFINRKNIFSGVDSRERFSLVIASMENDSSDIKCRFYCKELDEWKSNTPRHFELSSNDIKKSSPEEYTFIEPPEPQLGEIFLKFQHEITEAGRLKPLESLGAPSQEVNTTEAGEEFILLNEAEENDASYQEGGFWVLEDRTKALPVIEGRKVGNFDPFQKEWISGRGRSAVWHDIPWDDKRPGPQFLAPISETLSRKSVYPGYKLAFMRKGHATNTRTMIASLYRGLPCLDTAYALPIESIEEGLFLDGIFNSFIMDFQVRTVLGGSTLSWFLIGRMMYPTQVPENLKHHVQIRVASLNLAAKFWAPEWMYLREQWGLDGAPDDYFAVNEDDRLRIEAQTNALVAHAYGISNEDLTEILSNDKERQTGFFRVDNDLPWKERRTYKSIEYHDKLEKGEWQPSSNLEISTSLGIDWESLEAISESIAGDTAQFIKDMEEQTHEFVWRQRLRDLE